MVKVTATFLATIVGISGSPEDILALHKRGRNGWERFGAPALLALRGAVEHYMQVDYLLGASNEDLIGYKEAYLMECNMIAVAVRLPRRAFEELILTDPSGSNHFTSGPNCIAVSSHHSNLLDSTGSFCVFTCIRLLLCLRGLYSATSNDEPDPSRPTSSLAHCRSWSTAFRYSNCAKT